MLDRLTFILRPEKSKFMFSLLGLSAASSANWPARGRSPCTGREGPVNAFFGGVTSLARETF